MAEATKEGKSALVDSSVPFEPAGMIEYSEGSIVSREILKNKAGSITLFAFDKGQGLSEHTAPFDAVVSVLEGNAEVIIDGNNITTGAGKTVIMPADVPHAIEAQERFKMMLVMIRG